MRYRAMKLQNGSALTGSVGFALAVIALFIASRDRIPQTGLQSFLHMRLTLMNAAFGIGFAFAWQHSIELFGLRDKTRSLGLSAIVRILQCCIVMTCVLGVYLLAEHTTQPVFRLLLVFYICAVVCELFAFWLARPASLVDVPRVIILGSGRRAGKAWRELRTRYHKEKKVLGFVDDRNPAEMSPDIADQHLCDIEGLSKLLLQEAVDEIIVATPMQSSYETTQRAVRIAEAMGVRVLCLSDIYTLSAQGTRSADTEMFLELVPAPRIHLLGRTIKRILDVVVASALLILGLPALILLWVVSGLGKGKALVNKQIVYGFRRRTFQLYSLDRNAPRVLHWARLDVFLKMSSVLKGELSLVGPRPLTIDELSNMGTRELARRFCVQPGATGTWRISGNSLTIGKSESPDARNYLERWSFLLDLQLLRRAKFDATKSGVGPEAYTGTA